MIGNAYENLPQTHLFSTKNEMHSTDVPIDYGIPPLPKCDDIIGDHEDTFHAQQAKQRSVSNAFDALASSNLYEGALQNDLGSHHGLRSHSADGQTDASQQNNFHGAYYPSYSPYDQGIPAPSRSSLKAPFNAAGDAHNQRSVVHFDDADRSKHRVTPTSPIQSVDIFHPRTNDHNTIQGMQPNALNRTSAGPGTEEYSNSTKIEYPYQPSYGSYHQDFSDMTHHGLHQHPNFYANQYYPQWGDQRGNENSMQGYYAPQPDYYGSNGAYSHHGSNPNKRSLDAAQGETQTGNRRKPPKKRVKRSDDMPRYPLSAYNFFFSEEREVALALLSAPVEDLEAFEQDDNIPDAVPCSSEDSSDCSSASATASSLKSSFSNEFPPFENQQEEFEYISRILACRKMSEDKMEELRAKIKANTDRKLNTLFEGDKVKKSHKKSHGKITFQVLSRLIGQRWRDITDANIKQRYFDLAKKDQERYNAHMKEYKQGKK